MANFDDCDFFMWVEELRLMLHQWFGRLDFVTLIQDLRLHPSMNLALFVWLPQVLASASASAATAASMRTVVVRFADAAADAVAYYIATAGFIGVSRRTRRSDAAFGRGVRTRRSDAASDAASCVN
ncbi:unnamed protein product [Brassica napus]|uniref:(rape) hypothetical protein n=1 Tax=Brassica napus TaxID=3708 RepID=A0A816MGM0_BRANA|nr:unnamed protein product [Brassica napus]